MTTKTAPKFFTIRRSKEKTFMCFLRGKYVGSVLPDGKQFWAVVPEPYRASDMFNTFAEAEAWLWRHFC